MYGNLEQMLVESMRDLDEMRVMRYSVEMAEAGISSYVIFEKLLEGLKEVDIQYETGQYFIADLIMAGHILKNVMKKVLLFDGSEEYESFGRIVIATVKDDIHELGKNVITNVLEHNGFTICDLGVDVSAERITEAVMAFKPHILLLSGSLSGSPQQMSETIMTLADAGLRNKIRIIVGGAAVTARLADDIGADAYSATIKDCLMTCHTFMAMAAGGI